MNALKSFFLSLDKTEGYALQEKDITKSSVPDMAVELLFQIENILASKSLRKKN